MSLAPSTAELPLELNSDIRGVLGRLLERAQTERFFNIALSWFGTFWIGLFIVLNLAALISLPAVGGITKLEEIYSPLPDVDCRGSCAVARSGRNPGQRSTGETFVRSRRDPRLPEWERRAYWFDVSNLRSDVVICGCLRCMGGAFNVPELIRH